MFKRLNTGGSNLSPQEIRNCTARMAGEPGIKFYNFLIEMSSYEPFKNCTSTLADSIRDRKGDEELVLRFFAAKNYRDKFKGNVTEWLNSYMEQIVLSKTDFDYKKEERAFTALFDYLDDILGDKAFVYYRDNKPIGGLKPAYYEAVAIGLYNSLNKVKNIEKQDVRNRIIKTIQTSEFTEHVGSGSSSLKNLKGRIQIISSSLKDMQK